MKTPACNFIEKEIPSQVFSCEFCEIFKNRRPPVAASVDCLQCSESSQTHT